MTETIDEVAPKQRGRSRLSRPSTSRVWQSSWWPRPGRSLVS